MGMIDWLSVAAGFGLGMLGNVLSDDVSASADRVCTKILKRASLRLAPFQREEQEREWLAHLSECLTVSEKYWHATGCFWAAPRMRRQAEAVLLVANYVVPGVGRVPLKININARRSKLILFFLKTNIPNIAKTTIVIVTLFFVLMKLFANARHNGSEEFRVFAKTVGNIGKWDCEIFLRGRAVNLDISVLYKILKRNPKVSKPIIEDYIKNLSDILKQKKPPHQE